MDIIVKKSKIAGKGAFANRDFKKDEVVLNWHPKLLNKEELLNYSDQKEYIYRDKGKVFLMMEPERNINHSCDPNTKADTKGYCDVVIKNIKKGEEITSDYSGSSNPDFICNCGSKNCKGFFTDKK